MTEKIECIQCGIAVKYIVDGRCSYCNGRNRQIANRKKQYDRKAVFGIRKSNSVEFPTLSEKPYMSNRTGLKNN